LYVLRIFHSIFSYACIGTTDVELFEYIRGDGHTGVLIDTPGFDDSSKDNTRVLEEVVRTLNTFYAEDCLRIVGILYFQRISDVRMSGSSLKTLRIFEKMCGVDCFRKVIIVTTFWGFFQHDQRGLGEEREQALRTDPAFFGTLLDGGATMKRYLDTQSSARSIVDDLFYYAESVVLSVQREMVDGRSLLSETAVGQLLADDLTTMREKYERALKNLEEDYEDAIASQEDEDVVASMVEERQTFQERILQSQIAQENLYISCEEMARKQQELVSNGTRHISEGANETSMKSARELELEEQIERNDMDHVRELNVMRRDIEAKLRGTEAEVTEPHQVELLRQRLSRVEDELALERMKRKKSQAKAKSRNIWQQLLANAGVDAIKWSLNYPGPRRTDSAPLDSTKQPGKHRLKRSAWLVPRPRRSRKPKVGETQSEDDEDEDEDEDDSDYEESPAMDYEIHHSNRPYPENTSIAERSEPSTTGPLRIPVPFRPMTRSFTVQEPTGGYISRQEYR
jgi:hypothetical protein